MTFTLFSVIILSIFAIMVALQVYKGYKRGLNDSLIYLALFVASLLVSIVLLPLITPLLAVGFVEAFRQIVLYQLIVSWFPVFETLIDPLAQMLFGILLFLPILFVLYQLSKVILGVAKRIYRKKHPMSVSDFYTDETDSDLYKRSHVAGAWVGVLSGFLLTVVILIPVIGSFSIVDRTLSVCESFGFDMQSIEKERKEIGFYAHDAGATVVRFCGGDLIFNSISCAQVDGKRVSLNRELEVIEHFELEKLKKLLSDMDSLTEDDLKNFKTQLTVIEDSLFLRAMTAQTLSWASGDWLSGNTFYGAPLPSFGNDELVDPMMTRILMACRETTADTVVSDMLVLLDFIQWVSDMRSQFEDGDYFSVMSNFSDGGFEQYFRNAGKGALTSELLRDEVQSLAMRALIMETRNLSKYSEEAYGILLVDLADSVNDVNLLSESSRSATLNSRLKKNYKKLGVNLSSAVSSAYTESMLDYFSDEETADGAMISEYFDKVVAPYSLGT